MKNKTFVIALIPIKEHSERVEGKNFRTFVDKPLYHHIIRTLDETKVIDEILINTDSDRVLEESPTLSDKVRVLRRPKKLCGDCVSTNKLFAYDLEHSNADIYLQTHATNPLLQSNTFEKAFRIYLENRHKYDSLFSVNEYRSRFYDSKCKPINHDPQEMIRTQDLSPLYEENSCIYIFNKQSFQSTQSRIGKRPYMFISSPVESIDIDDEEQFRLAEIIAKANLVY